MISATQVPYRTPIVGGRKSIYLSGCHHSTTDVVFGGAARFQFYAREAGAVTRVYFTFVNAGTRSLDQSTLVYISIHNQTLGGTLILTKSGEHYNPSFSSTFFNDGDELYFQIGYTGLEDVSECFFCRIDYE